MTKCKWNQTLSPRLLSSLVDGVWGFSEVSGFPFGGIRIAYLIKKCGREIQMSMILLSKALRFVKDKSGASAAEYALILAIVGAAIAAAAILLGETIAEALNAASDCISSNGTDCN